ncbi:hypothetical protein [Paenibacillus graminis]|uniref:hypothetical protein n=2 Tax=Paenibacillus graminis TaxID=189425 RepID=UPI0030EECC31
MSAMPDDKKASRPELRLEGCDLNWAYDVSGFVQQHQAAEDLAMERQAQKFQPPGISGCRNFRPSGLQAVGILGRENP